MPGINPSGEFHLDALVEYEPIVDTHGLVIQIIWEHNEGRPIYVNNNV